MKQYDSWQGYKRLIVFLKPYRVRVFIGFICMACSGASNVVVPWLIKDVIDKVLANKDIYTLNLIAIAILVLFALRGVFYFGQKYFMTFVGQRIVNDIRERLYRHLQRLSLSYFDRHKTGALMSNLTNDVTTLQNVITNNMVSLVQEAVILIGSLISMIVLYWKLTVITLLIIPLVIFTVNYFGKRLRLAGHDVQGKLADITTLLEEALSSIRIIRSFNREDFEIKRFLVQNDYNFQALMKATKLTALLIYAINLTNPVRRISEILGDIQRSLAAADRVFEILDTDSEVQEKKGAQVLPPVAGHIVFSHVTFSYDRKKTALQDFTLTIKPGQVVALVGPSGAGKSTIANLLPRFYDVTSGSVRIDGIDVRDVTYASLRRQIGLVPQETMLFNTTIYENILYGRLDATREEVDAAAKAANAYSFIQQLPQGYDTLVGDRGLALSGGQRHRIAIARAILKNPRILILDEATSALDTESEKIVQAALEQLMKNRTAVVIAHRLSTIRHADYIVVIDHGKMAEAGTHEELIAQKGLYAKLYAVQFKQEERGE